MPRFPLHRLSQHLSPVRRLATDIQLTAGGRHVWKTLSASHWQQLVARNIERRLADLERQRGHTAAMHAKMEVLEAQLAACKKPLDARPRCLADVERTITALRGAAHRPAAKPTSCGGRLYELIVILAPPCCFVAAMLTENVFLFCLGLFIFAVF
mmetsp:Transcript_45680/g.128994  ORF Transcript_45680/g.128994 Transcript_45680/m.128994 type:complete len:155 (-) Transcript_45680:535-999(-)